MKKIITLVLCILFLSGCASVPEDINTKPESPNPKLFLVTHINGSISQVYAVGCSWIGIASSDEPGHLICYGNYLYVWTSAEYLPLSDKYVWAQFYDSNSVVYDGYAISWQIVTEPTP